MGGVSGLIRFLGLFLGVFLGTFGVFAVLVLVVGDFIAAGDSGSPGDIPAFSFFVDLGLKGGVVIPDAATFLLVSAKSACNKPLAGMGKPCLFTSFFSPSSFVRMGAKREVLLAFILWILGRVGDE
jgi:hypothetical protein